MSMTEPLAIAFFTNHRRETQVSSYSRTEVAKGQTQKGIDEK